MLQVRTAPSRVRDDRIKLLRRNLVDLLARELLRQSPLSVVRVERTAAELASWRENFATILRQSFRRVAIDVAENKVLGATGEQRNTVAPRADCRCNRRDQLLRKLRLHRRRHRFQFPESFRNELQDAAAPDQRLQAKSLVQSQHPPGPLQPALLHEQPTQREVADQTSPGRFEQPAIFGFGTRLLK